MKEATTTLHERRQIWAEKEILRRLYENWYGMVISSLTPGKTLEVGGGSGNLNEYFPDMFTSDIVFVPWLNAVLDAQYLPLKAESLGNVVLFDVLHHIPDPLTFFDECRRVLRYGGRLILVEPYVSILSFPVYRFLHQEPCAWRTDPFRTGCATGKGAPFNGNQAVPTLIFERHLSRFQNLFPELQVIEQRRMDFFLYPLSGGFHHRCWFPLFLYPALARVEKMLQPLNRLLSFRIFLILEKRPLD
jgi:SAM-dependent methyltransferase